MATAPLNEETIKQVLRQVEFYFSDSNLPRDNFLRKTIEESEDGLVSLALICSFSRMRNYLGLGEVKADGVSEETVKAVAEVLRQSSSLRLSEDGKKIGRASQLLKPEEVIEQVDARTIAASPLAYDVKLEDVESFFGQHAKVNSVRLPRHVADKRLFCGTALIEFSAEEDAEKLLNQSLVYAGVSLDFKLKKDFDAERAKEAEQVEKLRPNEGSNRGKGSNDGANNYPKGLIVAFTLKSMSVGDTQEQNGNPQTANGATASVEEEGKIASSEGVPEEMKLDSVNEKNNKENHEDNIKESEEKVEEKTSSEGEGKENIGATEKDVEKVERKFDAAACKNDKNVVMREDLKEVFKQYGTVKFVDFKIGESSGYIRFEGPEAAQKARAAAVLSKEGGLVVKNFVASLEPVTGDAETEYWSFLRGGKERHHERHRENKFSRGRGGRNNRGGSGRQFYGKQGRSRENDSSDRPNKSQKIEAA